MLARAARPGPREDANPIHNQTAPKGIRPRRLRVQPRGMAGHFSTARQPDQHLLTVGAKFGKRPRDREDDKLAELESNPRGTQSLRPRPGYFGLAAGALKNRLPHSAHSHRCPPAFLVSSMG